MWFFSYLELNKYAYYDTVVYWRIEESFEIKTEGGVACDRNSVVSALRILVEASLYLL